MICPRCKESPNPSLVSLLPRQLALKLIVDKLVPLIGTDKEIIQQIEQAIQVQAESMQLPNKDDIGDIDQKLSRLDRQIEFVLGAPAETDRDVTENYARIKQLRAERAAVCRQSAGFEESSKRVHSVPTHDKISGCLSNLSRTLTDALSSDEPSVHAAARRIIIALTGGRIVVSQQGERKAKRGWLRGSFEISILKCASQSLGFSLDEVGCQIVVDFRQPSLGEQLANRARELFDAGLLISEIGNKLECGYTLTMNALKHSFVSRNEPIPNFIERSSVIMRKANGPPKFERIADAAKAKHDQGLKKYEIARDLGADRVTVTKAIAFWHTSRGLRVPTNRRRTRRRISAEEPKACAVADEREIAKSATGRSSQEFNHAD